MLVGELRSRGLDVIATHEPGGTPLGRRLREAFLETEETVAPMAELLIFAADRAQHVELLIKPALADGRIVISDRFSDATVAYQGGGRLFGRKTVEKVIKLATGGLSPDLTLYFDISVEHALARLSERVSSSAKTDRMDVETAEFYSRVREEYLSIAKREPKRFVIIDASGSIEETHRIVMNTIDRFLENNNV